MKLHEDINAFRVLLNDIYERTGYRLDVLEKDYYVVLLLEELAKKQQEGSLHKSKLFSITACGNAGCVEKYDSFH